MFCPVCSQEPLNNEIRFCSGCGFPLIGVSQLVANGGMLPQELEKFEENKMSRRKRGIKRGASLILIGLIIVPIISIITIAAKSEPYVAAIAAILTFWGGILRILYALLFESGDAKSEEKKLLPAFLKRRFSAGKNESALPPAHQTTNLDYMPPIAGWRDKRDTNDLIGVPSVTDETTKLLEKKRAS